jgi:hypothetical protein
LSLLRTAFHHEHEPLRVAKWQRPQQGGISQREHRAVGADAERQRDRGDERESWRRPQLPRGEHQVLHEFLEPLTQSHLALSLSPQVHTRALQTTDVAEPRQHGFTRGFRIHAARNQFAGAHLDVEGDLFVHLLVHIDTP